MCNRFCACRVAEPAVLSLNFKVTVAKCVTASALVAIAALKIVAHLSLELFIQAKQNFHIFPVKPGAGKNVSDLP